MPGLRILSAAALLTLLSACATNPSTTAEDADAEPGEVVEPAAAPEASDGQTSAATPATAAAKEIYYTTAETAQMTICVDLADTAMHTAVRKRGGMDQVDAMNIYRTRPHPETHMAVVEQVYADTVGNVWDYTVRHFQHCSVMEAKVPQERLKLASYCMQRQMIGDLSYSFKADGRPISEAYGYFAKFRSPVVRQIIDAVYATDASKEDVKAQLWNACMAPITG